MDNDTSPLGTLQTLPSAMPQDTNPHKQSASVMSKVILGVVAFILIGEVALAAYYFLGRKSANTPVVTVAPVATQSAQPAASSSAVAIDTDFWRTSAIASFSAQDLQSIQTAIVKNGEPLGGKIVIINAQRSGAWALITTGIVVATTNKLSQTTPTIALAHLESTQVWYVTFPGKPDFCTVLQKAQTSLAIDQISYNYYCSGNTATASATSQ